MKFKKADLLLVAFLLIASALSFIIIRANSTDGAYVVVWVEGAETEKYRLSKNGTYVLNGGTNTMVVRDGKVHMESAECPDKLCVHMGTISYTGQAIICLPNKLVLTIEGVPGETDI